MSDQPETAGALAGVRVVDLSRVLGGPYCTQILGDHGADVIKVEPPGGDETRDFGPPFETDADGRIVSSAYYLGVNRNKRGIALDLGTEAGRAVVLRLLEGADVLVENFRTGTMERWGLGYDQALSERFPRLVYCRVSGFGADGPLGGNPGYDSVVQAMAGLFSVNGTPESGPTRIGVPIVDMVTGLYAAVGVTMALMERARSDRGQFIDATLLDCGLSILHPHAAGWLLNGHMPQLTGNTHPYVTPYALFPTRTRPLFLGIANDGQFRKLADVLGRPELATDDRFRTNRLRGENRAALSAILTPLLAEWDGDELARRLLAVGVAAGPTNTVAEILTDPHVAHRRMVVEQDGYKGVGSPLALGRTPWSARRPPPAFAADTRAVLAEAGYADTEIDALIADGAVVVERRR